MGILKFSTDSVRLTMKIKPHIFKYEKVYLARSNQTESMENEGKMYNSKILDI